MAKWRSGGQAHEVLEFARKCLHQIANVPIHSISSKSVIGEDIELESVALVEFQVALEDKFDVQLDPLEILECGPLDRIVQYVIGEMANLGTSEMPPQQQATRKTGKP